MPVVSVRYSSVDSISVSVDSISVHRTLSVHFILYVINIKFVVLFPFIIVITYCVVHLTYILFFKHIILFNLQNIFSVHNSAFYDVATAEFLPFQRGSPRDGRNLRKWI